MTFRLTRKISSSITMTAPTALIPVANGSEEIETVCLQDVLVRGGIQVTLASVGGNAQNVVKMSRGLHIQADVAIAECVHNSYDVIVLPGLLPPGPVTSYPSFQDKMPGVAYSSDRVVVTANCVTSRGIKTCYAEDDSSRSFEYVGPGTAMEMGLKLVEVLCGSRKAAAVADGLLFQSH
ncbi:hypothetical protein DYB31_000555 [Aphanomyces astaci]|uniref:DJ-1/PfpI domain-containing protein n=1 Tax=Aphanomyces astaci TaxID=112090 RepID=A0A397EZP2_APHAT|nr:hypothetical protein DYB31_000555 [Aphanomyces astaci]